MIYINLNHFLYKNKMKNHEFVDDVATKILRYNNKIYLSDINDIIKKDI